jgi:LPS-assembly lipoprotein
MRIALGLAGLVLVASCGFQLRGSSTLPFDAIYLPGGATVGIALDLKRNIEAGTNARVVQDAKQADAVLQFTQELRNKEVISLTASGRVREFRLVYQVGFRVHDAKGADYVPLTQLSLNRDITFNDEAILAKEAEEQLLFRDMQTDMVQLIMRRLTGAQRPKAADAAPR